MSAFIKLVSTSGTGTYLGIPTSGKGMFKQTRDAMGLRSHAIAITLGEEPAVVTEVKMNQTVKLTPPVTLQPKRYTVLLGFNPKLAEYGMVSCSGVVPPGEELAMTFRASKNVDLSQLEYIFTYYMLD